MPVEKFTISRDDSVHECFPHLCRTRSGRIILAYRESNGHVASEFCRIIVRYSDDAGHTWSARQVYSDADMSGGVMSVANCPKIQELEDGRVLLLSEHYDFPPGEWYVEDTARTHFWFSDDDGKSFAGPQIASVPGICPDQITEMPDGRWLLPTNVRDEADHIIQVISVSRNRGKTWDAPFPISEDPNYEIDEASIVKMPDGELVCYEREDSGGPLQKMISRDGGATWEGPFDTLNIAAIGMPIAGLTQDGLILITGRYGLPSTWRVDMSEEAWEKRFAKRTIVIPKMKDHADNARFVASINRGAHVRETDTEIIMSAGGSSGSGRQPVRRQRLHRMGGIRTRQVSRGELHQRRRAARTDPRLSLQPG